MSRSTDDSHLVELYVRNPEALAPDERARIAERIADDALYRETWAYWTAYYETLRDVERQTGTVVRLLPFVSGTSDDALRTVTVLAAQEPVAARRHRTLAVLETPTGDALVRVMWDAQRRVMTAFVMGDAVAQAPMLYFPALKWATGIDASGRSSPYSRRESAPATESLGHVLMALPDAQGTFAGGRCLLESAHARLDLTADGGGVQGTFSGSSDRAWYVSHASEEGFPELVRVVSGPVRVSSVQTQPISVRLYGL